MMTKDENQNENIENLKTTDSLFDSEKKQLNESEESTIATELIEIFAPDRKKDKKKNKIKKEKKKDHKNSKIKSLEKQLKKLKKKIKKLSKKIKKK